MENTVALTFQDIFKNSFIASTGNMANFSTIDIVLNLFVSFLIGLFIYFVYKKTFQGVLYQKSFNVSLVLISTITTLIIMTISNNIILSLGMVGALSIVRFRTPIKDSIDLVFLFWAIATGIANGVGYFSISVIGSVMIGLMALGLSKTQSKDECYLSVIRYPNEVAEENILENLKKIKHKLKSKTVNESYSEITLELKTKAEGLKFIDNLKGINNEIKATLVAVSEE